MVFFTQLSGFSDSILDKVSDDKELLMKYGPKLNELLTGRAGKAIESERKKGSEYVTKYLLGNPRAIKSPTGLIYTETLAGIGGQPDAKSTVTVHYHGTLIDGTVFDSSVDRGEPISFPLSNVIKGFFFCFDQLKSILILILSIPNINLFVVGWQEGVAMMREGGKATLVIPSDLAYGDGGSPPVIPPGKRQSGSNYYNISSITP